MSARGHELAVKTGMTATEVIEDALRGYEPAGEPVAVDALVRRGPLLVLPARAGERISHTDADAALDATRNRLS